MLVEQTTEPVLTLSPPESFRYLLVKKLFSTLPPTVHVDHDSVSLYGFYLLLFQ